MRSTRTLAFLVPIMLLAGCTQLDDAKQAAADAQAKLDEAREEAEQAKARYDRVKSATIVRTEVIQLNLTARIHNGTVTFDPEASRAGAPILDENLTRLPPLVLEALSFRVECDPLACRAELPAEGILLSWADDPDGGMRLTVSEGCDAAPEGATTCPLPRLSRDAIEARVTSELGDVTA